MAKLTIDQVDVSGKRVLTRVDFNVPFDDHGAISDDRRITAALPTIKSILDRGGSVVLMSHLGRPSGTGFQSEFSLKPVADKLASMLPGVSVNFPSQDCIDDATASAVNELQPGGVILLENLRFHAGESSNDAEFAKKLAAYGDIYCNDAFGTVHRAHASIVGVPNAMPKSAKAVAGLLVQRELTYFRDTLENPAAPFVAIIGGAKVKDKIPVLRNLLPKVDTMLIGGAMAYTFLKVIDRRVGKSRVDQDSMDAAQQVIDSAAEHKADLFLPRDHVCGKEVSEQTPIEVFPDHIEDDWMGLDIGPKTQALFAEKIANAKTILWNGPMGVFEVGPFRVGTETVAKAVADATQKGAVSVIGGGDSAAAIDQMNLADRVSHISTGGGASLALIEGKSLPGIEALDD